MSKKITGPHGESSANRKAGSKSRASTATSGARPVNKGIPGQHASPESRTRQVKGKSNLPLESLRKDSLPKAVDIRKKS